MGLSTSGGSSGMSPSSVDTLTNKTYDTAGTGNSFSINGIAATANTGTGSVVRAASPTLVTPALGAASATSLDAPLLNPTAHVLEQRNGANPQTARFYNTYADGSNYSRLAIIPGSSETKVITQQAGSGAHMNLELRSSWGGALTIGGTITTFANFIGNTDNAYDIGANTTNRFRTGYFGTGLQVSEVASDPTAASLTSGSNAKDRVRMYMKNDKLVFAYNDGAGNVNYLSIALDGSTTAWTNSNSAP